MRILHIIMPVLFLIVNCSSPKNYDKIEYLKKCLIEYGFHPDTTFNIYREYTWKVKKNKNDSLLLREAEFYLLDTIYYNQNFSIPEKYYYLKIQEYQYFPERKKEYAEEHFPTIYEVEKERCQFFDRFYNLSKGLRHLAVPSSVELQQKITLENRYILLIIKFDRNRATDTTKIRNLLETIKDGISQSSKENAQLKYSLIRESILLKNNLLAGKISKASVTTVDTNKPPMAQEAERLNNLKKTINATIANCQCVDVCTAEDGCIYGGYIYITIVTTLGLPVEAVECTLAGHDGNKYTNITNEFGCVGWCRVPKDNYMAIIYYKNKKYDFVPVWDSLPRTILFELK